MDTRPATFLASWLAVAALAGCELRYEDEESRSRGNQPGNGYRVDTATGTTTARITNDEGTTTLRAGENVVPWLPVGFTVYPGAQVVHTTQVARGGGQSTLLTMESEASPEEMAAHYRRQAEAAGITLGMTIPAGGSQTLSGKGEGGLTFSFHAAPRRGRTRAELAVRQGLD